MKRFLLFIGIVTMLSACKSYLISTVSSTNTSRDESTGMFIMENDSLKISYNFAGENTPPTVEIFNKLKEPLFVNWENSALILGDKTFSFVDNNIQINGEISANSMNYSKGDSYTYGNLSATAKLSKNTSFLPPNAKSYRTLSAFKAVENLKIQDIAFKREELNYNNGTGGVNTKIAYFSATDSPVKFRCYLTFYTMNDNKPHSFFYEQNFYVSAMTKTTVNPKNLLEYENNKSDVMVHSKTNGFGKTMTSIALVGAAGSLVAADAALNGHQKGQK